MAAYLMVTVHEITDPERFGDYGRRVGATIAAYGGRYLTGRHYLVERLEGDTEPSGNAIMEFASKERIREWYHSAPYQELLRLRQGAARVEIFIVEGADSAQIER